MDEQKNKQIVVQIMFFIAGRIPVNEESIKDIYSKIIYLFDEKMPDDIKVGIRNDKNEDVEINVNEYPEFLVYRFYDLINKPKFDIYNSIITTNTDLLLSHSLSDLLLITILKYELQFLRSVIEIPLSQKADDELDRYFSSRIGFISNYIKDNSESLVDDESPLILFIELLNLQIDIAIRQERITEKFGIIREYVNRDIHTKITQHILVREIEIAKEFAMKTQDELVNFLHNHSKYFTIAERDQILNFIHADPGNVIVSSLAQGGGEINIDYTKIRTIIRFIAHGNIKNSKFIDYFTIGFRSGEIKLIARRITSYLDDPVVSKIIIGGLESQYISDFNPSKDFENVEFQLQFEDFIHPQFDLDGSKVILKDFSREERFIGRQYHPIKNKVLEFLLNVRSKLDSVFQIPDSIFNISMFSNYSIEYFDKLANELIYKRIYLFTNPNSFETSRSIYFSKLTQQSLSSSYLQISQLMKNSHIETEYLLQQFVYKLLNIVVKQSIELSGNYRYCWKFHTNGNRMPLSESEIQPLLMNQLRTILEIRGINISKEPEISNGKLDFECSYNYNERLLKCAIEIKNAYHGKIIDGISKQLPRYMEQSGKYGIFCVLWFKGEWFSDPANYDSIDDLEHMLIESVPTNLNIEVLGINCTKPLSPSLL